VQKLKDLCPFKAICTLETGNVFGERALLENRKRTARVTCLSDCEFAVMTSKDFMEILAAVENERIKKIKAFLNSIPLFEDWNPKQIASLHLKTEMVS